MEPILIIDDDVAIGNLEQEVLEWEGYLVQRAYSGTEALLLLNNFLLLSQAPPAFHPCHPAGKNISGWQHDFAPVYPQEMLHWHSYMFRFQPWNGYGSPHPPSS